MVFWLFKKKSDHEIKKIHNIMENSFSNIKKDMSNISSWINHFKDKHEKHDNSFEKIMKEIEYLKSTFERHLEEHHSEVEQPFERSIAIERVQSFKHSSQSFMNVQDLKDKLTPSQKRVLILLDKTNVPLDYETIANELKLNIVTVRRHVNDIKKVFEIKEMMDIDRGRKVFCIGKEAKLILKRNK